MRILPIEFAIVEFNLVSCCHPTASVDLLELVGAEAQPRGLAEAHLRKGVGLYRESDNMWANL